MKRQFLLLFAIAVFVAGMTTNVSAQPSRTLRTYVKFDFQIGDRIYPAGEYRIESLSSQSTNLLLIRNVSDANKSQIILSYQSEVPKTATPKLVFFKYGEQYFLRQVFLDCAECGYSITPTRSQRESEKNLAARLAKNN